MFLLTNIVLTSLLSQPPLTLDQLKEYVKCLMAERDYVRQQERQIKVQIKSVKKEIMALKQQLKRPAKDVKEVGNKVISDINHFSILYPFWETNLALVSSPTSLAQKKSHRQGAEPQKKSRQ